MPRWWGGGVTLPWQNPQPEAMIRVRRHPRGPRVYVLGRRCHHGAGGAILSAAALLLRRPRLAAALALWAATDWRDFPWRDDCNH